MKTSSQKGFTLVELAIVLVIIGLIVGGVLVGQDLIKAATVRSTLGDIEKYNAAATTFRNKYSGLPGDLLSSNATQFGMLTATGRDGTAGRGDGNGIVEGCAAGATAAGCETALFWVDLSTAQLIPQNLATYDSTATAVANTTSIATLAGYFPTQKLRQGTFAYVYPVSGRNHFLVSTLSIAGGAGAVTAGAGVTPGEARSMDEKLDDALPATGVVQAVSNLTTVDVGAAAATGVCVNSTPAPDTYNAGTAFIDEINCRVRLRASF
jgi:prepilin-type N-terminal cleavage/methylation domain-containing protein